MTTGSKSEELSFHIDRVKESTLRVLKSVALDPRVSPEEKLGLLTQIAGVHVEMAEMIHSAIEGGCHKAMSALAAQPSTTEKQTETTTDFLH